MTLDNGIGGTTVVTASPSSSAAATSPGSMKHSLRSAVVAQVDAAETALLVNEEEKLMATNDIVDDEEVTSEEEEPDNEATERAMLTVALVKSVVETRALNHPGAPAGTPSSPGAHAYGLRKRRRPSGQDLERLEHFQSTKDGGLARVAKAPDVSTAPTGSAALLQHPPQEPPKLKKSVDSRDMKPPARPPRPPNLVQSAASSVPNPLLNKMDSPATAPVSATVHLESLSSYLLPDQDPGRNAFPVAVASEAQVAGASAESADRRKVTINEPELSSRKRGFSVDLDCTCLRILLLVSLFISRYGSLTVLRHVIPPQFSNLGSIHSVGLLTLAGVRGLTRLNALRLVLTLMNRYRLSIRSTKAV